MALQANALVTLQQAKDRLGITGTTEDTTLEELINSISDDFELYCGRIFRELTITGYELKGTDRQEIVLSQRPITAISKIELNSIELETKDNDELGGYYLIPDGMGREGYTGKVGRQCGWVSTGFVNNKLEYTKDTDFRNINISVDYTGGFETIPSNLQNATLTEISREYNYQNQGYREVLQEKVQSVSISATKDDINIETGWNRRTMNILNKYRNLVIL